MQGPEMPDRPTWCGNLPEITRQLQLLPDPWIDRRTLQELLSVGLRRAQQILAPCVTRQIGANGLANREDLIAHLQRLAASEISYYEQQRRRRLCEHLDGLHQERQHAVLVAAPAAVVNQEFADLPEGITLAVGLITISFQSPTEALEKLLALAIAIRNDELQFERLASG